MTKMRLYKPTMLIFAVSLAILITIIPFSWEHSTSVSSDSTERVGGREDDWVTATTPTPTQHITPHPPGLPVHQTNNPPHSQTVAVTHSSSSNGGSSVDDNSRQHASDTKSDDTVGVDSKTSDISDHKTVSSDPPDSPKNVHGTDVVITQNVTSESRGKVSEEDEANSSKEEPIASFDEWTKQKLEEQQRNKKPQQVVTLTKGGGASSVENKVLVEGSTTQTATNSGGHADATSHVTAVATQRNYASKECGAKILFTNPETQHTNAVLNEKERDEYLLNPCKTEGGKFFIVELCETIQPTVVEIANFELFSSSPKDFVVRVSERYPTMEWNLLGQWTAADLRQIQTFHVDQDKRMYAKFVKVELLSHYGSEHFCPMSLLRVSGISMVDEYEAEADEQEKLQHPPAPAAPPVQSTEQSSQSEDGKTEQNDDANRTGSEGILNVAKDTVINLVNGVKEVLGGTRKEDQHSLINSTGKLNYSICEGNTIESYLKSYQPWLLPCYLCSFGREEEWISDKFCYTFAPHSRSIPIAFPPQIQAPPPSRRTPTATGQPPEPALTIQTEIKDTSACPDHPKIVPNTVIFADKTATGSDTQKPPASVSLNGEDVSKNEKLSISAKSDSSESTSDQQKKSLTDENTEKPGEVMTVCLANNVSTSVRFANLIENLKRAAELKRTEELAKKRDQQNVSAHPAAPAAPIKVTHPVAVSHLPGSTTSQKESVFIRLNNRIKSLEQNLSLTSQYLSELSRQYKRQMEDIKRQYERASRLANETKKTAEERWRQQDTELRVWKGKARQMETLAMMIKEQQEFMQNELWKLMIGVLVGQTLFILAISWCWFGGQGKITLNRQFRLLLAEEIQKLVGNNGFVQNGHVPRGVSNGSCPAGDKESWGTQTDRQEQSKSPPKWIGVKERRKKKTFISSGGGKGKTSARCGPSRANPHPPPPPPPTPTPLNHTHTNNAFAILNNSPERKPTYTSNARNKHKAGLR